MRDADTARVYQFCPWDFQDEKLDGSLLETSRPRRCRHGCTLFCPPCAGPSGLGLRRCMGFHAPRDPRAGCIRSVVRRPSRGPSASRFGAI